MKTIFFLPLFILFMAYAQADVTNTKDTPIQDKLPIHNIDIDYTQFALLDTPLSQLNNSTLSYLDKRKQNEKYSSYTRDKEFEKIISYNYNTPAELHILRQGQFINQVNKLNNQLSTKLKNKSNILPIIPIEIQNFNKVSEFCLPIFKSN